ncbi:MAG: hypothetical protein IJM30_07240 [Thermoguttaceae bacterium]|nr:hypothetical protein [Thermoguttaceae bacterium]
MTSHNENKSFRLLFLASILISAAMCAGCGPRVVDVSGKIVVDGVPAENIRVVFQSASEALEVPPVAIGLTDQNGEYSLSLAEKKKKGAVPGPYVVYLTWRDPDAEENPIEGQTVAKEPPYKLPPRANSGELRFDVPKGGTKEADFEFDSSKETAPASIGV